MEEPEVIHKDNLILISSSFEIQTLSEPTPVKLSNKRVFKLNYHVGSFENSIHFHASNSDSLDCEKVIFVSRPLNLRGTKFVVGLCKKNDFLFY